MFKDYEIDNEAESYFIPDWRVEPEDETFDLWQIVCVDDEHPSMWELSLVTDVDFRE
jgi:hypothetical protein